MMQYQGSERHSISEFFDFLLEQEAKLGVNLQMDELVSAWLPLGIFSIPEMRKSLQVCL